MNLASWIILGIVIVIMALAVRATFFGGRKKGDGCCDTGNIPASTESCSEGAMPRGRMPVARTVVLDRDIAAQIAGCSKSECGSCTLCDGDSAVARNAVMPIVRPA